MLLDLAVEVGHVGRVGDVGHPVRSGTVVLLLDLVRGHWEGQEVGDRSDEHLDTDQKVLETVDCVDEGRKVGPVVR